MAYAPQEEHFAVVPHRPQHAVVPRSNAQLANTDQSAGTVSSPEPLIFREVEFAETVTAIDPETGRAAQFRVARKAQMVATEDGCRFRQATEMEANVVSVQALEMRDEPQEHVSPNEEPEDAHTYSEQKRCCEGCFAEFSWKEKRLTSLVQTRQLRDNRRKGWTVVTSNVFPFTFLHDCARETWTGLQFLVTLAILLYSCITFVLIDEDDRTIVDIFLLAFSIPSSLLSVFDLIITIYYQRCRLCLCRSPEGQSDDEAHRRKQRKQCHAWYAYFDLARLVLSEVFIYPVVICAIFQFVLAIIHVDSEMSWRVGLRIAFFAGGLLWKILFVYIIRLLVLVQTSQAIQRERDLEGPGRNSGIWFQIRFTLHVFGQMVSQMIMIASVSGRIYYENRNFRLSDNTGNFTFDNFTFDNFTFDNTSMNFTLDNTIHVSPYLWYMIVGAYFIPFLGIFTFAITNFYYCQMYPLGLYVDAVIFKKKSRDEDSLTQKKFTEMSNNSVFRKNRYVFLSPTLVMLCFLYTALLQGFAVCCVTDPLSLLMSTTGSEGFDLDRIPRNAVLGGSFGWTIFFVIGLILVNIANIAVVVVVLIWTVIIGIAIMAFSLVLVCFLLYIFCSSSNNDNKRK